MPDLFDLGDLPPWLQVPQVDTETATRVRRAANGWLQDATGLTEWPVPVPDRLWAWGVELAAIALRNPDGMGSKRDGDNSYVLDRHRRAEILEAARRAYSSAGAPVYSFPEPDWSWTATAVQNE